MWLDWLVFCDSCFQSVCPLMEKISSFWKLPDGRDWLRGKLGLALMSGAMLHTSLIQFSDDGWGCIPSLLFDLRPNIPAEQLQILKHSAVKVLHSIYQQIWKIQQWPQDWKRSAFIPILEKGNVKECSNYCTIALISHPSKVMLKLLQARLQ